MHYLDDFLFIEDTGSQPTALAKACFLMDTLEVPTAPHKVEGPTTCLMFLGMELDSSSLMARLPADKLYRLITSLNAWGNRKQCSKQELMSLIGILQHASIVI